MNYHGDDIVKSCRRLESGLRLGIEGIRACQLGQLSSPLFWTADEAAQTKITKEMIADKRRDLFNKLNDNHSNITCKGCHQVITKPFKDVMFTNLGRIDLAPSTICNLRCSFCGYTKHNSFTESKYDALAILNVFSPEDVEWDSAVDFNGGEPALLPDLDGYLDFFASRRIRVLLYTNAVKYRQSIYDGLMNGSLQWVCTSLDAGTPSSFKNLKKRDHYLQVLENLTRYAYAGSKGGGMLAVKYIFCDENCDDDDIAGFTYAMLAIRPQKVWLTFDFEPLTSLPGDSSDFGGYDYTKHINAYARMYGLMKKHGLTPVHYTEAHLAAVSQHGKILMERTLSEIDRLSADHTNVLILRDFRHDEKVPSEEPMIFYTSPLRISKGNGETEPWSLFGKRVVLAPACPRATALLAEPEIRESHILGFLDRDTVLHGKSIEGIIIYGYPDIKNLAPDVILIASPQQHQDDIVRTIASYADKTTPIAVLNNKS